VETGIGATEWFDITTGIRQGSVLGPLLFAAWIDPLVRRLERAQYEGTLLRAVLHMQVFADDMLTTATSLRDLRMQRDTVEAFMAWTGMSINKDKVVYACTEEALAAPAEDRPGGCKVVLGTGSFKHLGTLLAVNGSPAAATEAVMGDLRSRGAKLAAYRLSPHHAVWIISSYIHGMLRFHLRVRRWPRKTLDSMDVMLRGVLRRVARLPRDLCRGAIHLEGGLGFPSVVEIASASAAAVTLQRLNHAGPYGEAVREWLDWAKRATGMPCWPTEMPQTSVHLLKRAVSELSSLCASLAEADVAIVPTASASSLGQGSPVHLQMCVGNAPWAPRLLTEGRVAGLTECFKGNAVRDFCSGGSLNARSQEALVRAVGATAGTGVVDRDRLQQFLGDAELKRRDIGHIRRGEFVAMCQLNEDFLCTERNIYLYQVSEFQRGEGVGAPPQARLVWWRPTGSHGYYADENSHVEFVKCLEPVEVTSARETDEAENPAWARLGSTVPQLTATALVSLIRCRRDSLTPHDVVRGFNWGRVPWNVEDWRAARAYVSRKYRVSASRLLFCAAVDLVLQAGGEMAPLSVQWLRWRCPGDGIGESLIENDGDGQDDEDERAEDADGADADDGGAEEEDESRPPQSLVVAVDGSFDAAAGTAAVGVVVQDPQGRTFTFGAPVRGGAVSSTMGELDALASALGSVPASCDAVIYCDNMNAVQFANKLLEGGDAAIGGPSSRINETSPLGKEAVRMALASRAGQKRGETAVRTEVRKVKAHVEDPTPGSPEALNAMADTVANAARPARPEALWAPWLAGSGFRAVLATTRAPGGLLDVTAADHCHRGGQAAWLQQWRECPRQGLWFGRCDRAMLRAVLRVGTLTRFVIRAICSLLPCGRRAWRRGQEGTDRCTECPEEQDTQEHFVECGRATGTSMVAAAVGAIMAKARAMNLSTEALEELQGAVSDNESPEQRVLFVTGAWHAAMVSALEYVSRSALRALAEAGATAAMQEYARKFGARHPWPRGAAPASDDDDEQDNEDPAGGAQAMPAAGPGEENGP
jgi:ribonuclease HI